MGHEPSTSKVAERLAAPIAAGEGFVDLYRRESELVLMFCTRRVLDAEVALDLTAETFAQAYRGRRSFRGRTELEARAWILTIARRQIARFFERGSAERRMVERLGIQVPALGADDLERIEARAGLADIRALLRQELGALSAEQREALHLRVLEERSYAEVAAALGITEATARARVSRALRALAGALDAHPAIAGEGA